MGDLFRSEKMTLVQLFLQPEAAYSVMAELGESGCVQFRDLNEDINSFQREFAREIKRCNEMERRIRYIEAEIKKCDIRIEDITELPHAPHPREIINLEAHLEKNEQDIRELTESALTLKREYADLLQYKYVMTKAQTFFNQQDEAIYNGELTTEDIKSDSQLGFIAGVVNKGKMFSFERLLWRVGKGNIFMRQADIDELIEDPATGIQHRKCAFILFFQGENLLSKIKKICTGYRANLVDIPVSLSERTEKINKLTCEVLDVKTVINQTEDHRRRLLVAVARDIQNWNIMVCKIKAIYHTLNFFSQDVTKNLLIGEGWVPTSDLPNIQKALSNGATARDSAIPSFLNILQTKQSPPTFNRTNKFTRGFQNLVSAYAISTYRELNPALYTIITFPFLFAVMFGDVGHGLIMAMFGAVLILMEKRISAKKKLDEISSIFFGGRYIILLMGLFSVYTGFIYNDIFSKSMNIFGSKWFVDKDYVPNDLIKYDKNNEAATFELVPRLNYKGSPYFIGLDPAWQSAENKIIFLNSFKMKLSITIGVVHMVFGVVLSIVNFLHFKKISHIVLEFLPKFLFFSFLFVYLVIMIFMKWIMFSGMNDGPDPHEITPGYDTVHGSSCAPNILIFFIGMMLFKKSDAEINCEAYMYSGQETLQKLLLFGALICIPIMLLGVPIYEMLSRKKRQNNPKPTETQLNGHANHIDLKTIPETEVLDTHEHEEEEEEEPMSEIMVHAGIHTIEFTLSTVSHTASYLRLWALSLAHAQLSEVLWTMVFRKALVTLSMPYVGGVFIYIIFAVWAAITVSILVLMEGLSAFLHTLRLHWVEFMTKFYEGQGINFEPYSFKTMFEENQETD